MPDSTRQLANDAAIGRAARAVTAPRVACLRATRPSRARRADRSTGISTVELMVALAVGLLLSLFASALLLAAHANYAQQADAADMEDAGRYAIHALTAAVRQTAWQDWSLQADTDEYTPAPIAGLDDRTLPRTQDAIANPSPASVNGSDVLAIRFHAAADGSAMNCAGFPVNDDAHAWSVFYVARAADGEGELLCKYRGTHSWSADAIVRGVDSLQVLYGIDTDNPRDGIPNRYLTATQIAAADALLPLEGDTPEERARDLNRKTMWKRAVVLRLALLMHGTGRIRREGAAGQYDLFGPDYAAASDPGTRIDESTLPAALRLRERRVFAGAVMLRNQPW